MSTRRIKLFLCSLIATSAGFIGSSSAQVAAAACANTANYGVATFSVSVPQAGTYTVWLRMQPSSVNNTTVQVEVDGAQCWNMGGSTVPVGSWTWVNWAGTPTQKATATLATAGTHSVKLIGSSTDVYVDKLILLGISEKCSDDGQVPIGTGDNCDSAPAATPPPSTTTPPASNTVTPTIVSENSGNISQIKYYVGGKLVQTSNGEEPLDTSKLPEGQNTVETVVTLKNGQELKQTSVITIPKKTDMNSWYQRNALWVLGIAAVIVVTIITLGWYFRLFQRVKPYMDRVSQRFKHPPAAAQVPVASSAPDLLEPQVVRPTSAPTKGEK